MIRFVTTDMHLYTHEIFFRHYNSRIQGGVVVSGYHEVAVKERFDNEIVIMCDIERFSSKEIEVLVKIYERISERGAACVLNDPSKVMRRFALAQALREAEINKHGIYRPPITADLKIQFPVFVRNEFEHDGPCTPLLHSVPEVQRELANINLIRRESFSPVVIEFVDTRDSPHAQFRKYGAFNVCGIIIPQHLDFSNHWVVKYSPVKTFKEDALETSYLDSNKYQDIVRRVFQIAAIDYGRIDFAALDDGIEVFEINTNPMILKRSEIADEGRKQVNSEFVDRYANALNKLVEAETNH